LRYVIDIKDTKYTWRYIGKSRLVLSVW